MKTQENSQRFISMMQRSALLLVFVLLVTGTFTAGAQCPMCKISAESNLKNGGSAGRGLNKGILYLFFTPYLVVGGIGYAWYRNKKKGEDMEKDFPYPDKAQLN